ncbi:MAG: lysylphosphatidylglycerol synthase transmembrane domain-containing protein [Halobacteriales archaeon]
MSRRRIVVLGFLGSLLLLGALLSVVGIARIRAALATADRRLFAVVAAFALAQVFCWGLALRTVLGTLGVRVTRRLSFLLYGAATFSNNVTPFGQAGGEPVTALVIDRSTGSSYETGLAAIATVDALHVVTSLTVAVAGVFGVALTVAWNRQLRTVSLAALALAAVAALVGVALRRYSEGLWVALDRAVVGIADRTGAVLPWVPPDLGRRASEALSRFAGELGRIAGDRRVLAVALAFSGLGWLAKVGALSVALLSVDAPVPLATLLLIVPAAKVAGFAPLPGGFGSIESALVALLVATTPVGAAAATAAVLVHRAGTYWLPLVVGGAATALLEATEEGA